MAVSQLPPVTPDGGFAVYARLSKKKVGRAKKRRNQLETCERQIVIIRRWAAEEGIPISDALDEDGSPRHVFIDNHLSAWKEGERPRFEAMLAAAERREFPGILVYKLDRFARNTPDAYALTRLGDEYGLTVAGPYSGKIDLSTVEGRKRFRDAASSAEFESDNISERARDALRERAAMGLQIGGGRLFGFEILDEVREDDDDTEPVQRPAEVAIAREMGRRFVAGETLTKLITDLNARGITTTRGNPWTVNSLREMLAAPRNNGWVILHEKEVARNEGTLYMGDDGEIKEREAGEHIFDDDLYAEVQAVLAGRKRGRRPSGEFKLSGVLMCCAPAHGDTPHRMTGHGHRNAKGERVRDYLCSRTHGGCGTAILAAPVEERVREKVLESANDRDLVADLSAEAAALTEARTTAAAKVARLDGMLADLEERRALEEIRPHAYERAKKALDKRIADAESEAKLLGAAVKGGDVPPLTGEEYDDLNPAETRAMVEQLRLRVLIFPKSPGIAKNQWDPGRVQIEALARGR